MTKSFRNLVLSLFLAAGAAGFTACSDGNMGPAGEAGPAGAAGPAGPKGVPGETGKSFEELPRTYQFLKSWGKADGMLACNDLGPKNTDAFPGPAALTKLAAGDTKDGPPTAKQTPMIPLGTMPGDCSSELFLADDPFTFVQNQGTIADRKVERRRGTTSDFGNPTMTTAATNYWGGTVTVRFKQSAAEIMEREVLFDRCRAGKGPVSSGAGKSITGEYRIEGFTQWEALLERGTDGILKPKPAGTGGSPDYTVPTDFIIRICIRFSAPGTVKCYERTYTEKRKSDGSRPGRAGGIETERIALYKNGQMTLLEPMPVNGKLPGKGPNADTGGFPFGNQRHATNVITTGKLCNLFAGGVVPCGPNTSPNSNGDGGCS